MKTIAIDAAEPIAAAAPQPAVAAHPYRVLGTYRFLLAGLVLVSHASGFLPTYVEPLALGNVGVLLFFVVSGFVICEALDIFYRRSTAKFLLNRALKIYPAYLAALPIAYAALLWTGSRAATDPFGILVNLSLLLAYLPSGNNLLAISVAWAVIVEFQFYFAAAAIFFAARWLPRVPVLRLAAMLSLAFYLIVWWTDGHARFYGAFQFAPFFVLGALLYFRIAHGDRRLAPAILLAFLLAVHSYYAYNARGLLPGTVDLPWHVILSTGLFVAVFALMAILVTASVPRGAEHLDKRLGDLTYAVYLVHPSVILAVAALHWSDALSFATVVAVSFAFAILIRQLIERPIIRIRNRLRGHRLYD